MVTQKKVGACLRARSKLKILFAIFLVISLGLVCTITSAEIKLPRVISDNMVLQRGKPVPIWGWADKEEQVMVKFAGQKKSTQAGADGKWTVSLAPMKANSEPTEMAIEGSNKIVLKNILVGDVWLCSGQSNMEFSLASAKNAKKEVAEAKYPDIRLFHVQRASSGRPLNDVSGSWISCSPQSAKSFSAVGYFFGRYLYKELHVPIGLIESAWGGTRIEPWTPPEGFKSVSKLAKIVEQIRQAEPEYKKRVASSLDKVENWTTVSRKALNEDKLPPFPPTMPKHPLSDPWQPTSLYNAMIYPLVPFAIQGAIWYQGESNVGEGMMYFEKMKALIGGWRKVWGQEGLSFYYVQLAPFSWYSGEKLAAIWEAQTAALSIPHTGMAVTVDIGNLGNIHPKNKQDVGKRLALWALAKDYGKKDVVYSGPLYKNMKVDGDKIVLSFDYVDGGLTTWDGKELRCFTIAGADKKFVPAKAVIKGDKVVVSSEQVQSPVSVRMGWEKNDEPNLCNKAGLPASPFRTDEW